MPEESTTPDLVELTRRFLDAANRGDIDAMMSFYAPDAVYVMPELSTFEGAAAIRGFLEDMTSPFTDFHGEFEEIIDLGNGVVFFVPIATGRPVGSSGKLQIRFAGVAIWTEGVVVRQTNYNYTDIDEARAAAERLAEERGYAVAENRVQMIHTLTGLWNGGDFRVERFHEFFDPAIELESPLSSVAGEPYRGYAGIERWVRDQEEQFVEWALALHDARQIADQVIAFGAVKARGRASDVALEFPAAAVFDFGGNHRITRMHIYPNVEEALKAVGLEE